jgi:16S rRNA (cytosine967-C5)-methyltransferase
MKKSPDHIDKAREVAAKVILAFERSSKKTITDLLDEAIAAHPLDSRDCALAYQLSLGVIRNWFFLEFALSRFLRCRFRDTPPVGRALLRLGAFQALCLERIPAYALVDQSVRLATKLSRTKKLPAFINAVLRSLLRSNDEIRLPDESLEPDQFLSIRYSYPRWEVAYFTRLFGSFDSTRAFLEFCHSTAPIDLRVNTSRITVADCAKTIRETEPDIEIIGPGIFAPETLRLRAASRLDSREFFRAGYCYVQDEAEQLVSHAVNPQPGERIIDYCAAPGGKATHLAQLTNDQSEIIALDLSRSRLASVEENCARLGIKSVRTLLHGSEDSLTLQRNPADRVLVDAPCTGLGTLRRHPDLKLRLKSADIERMQRLQLEILDRALRMLKRGGTLVYSTCTITREENENVIQQFLARHKDLKLDDDFSYLPPAIRQLVTPQGFIRTIPHIHKIDGIFLARLHKT